MQLPSEAWYRTWQTLMGEPLETPALTGGGEGMTNEVKLLAYTNSRGQARVCCARCYDAIRDISHVPAHASCEPLPESPRRGRRQDVGAPILREVTGLEAGGGVPSGIEFKTGGGVLSLDGVWYGAPEAKGLPGKRGSFIEHKAVFPTDGDPWGRPRGRVEALQDELADTDARLTAMLREYAVLSDQLDRSAHQAEVQGIFDRILGQERQAQQEQLQLMRRRLTAMHGVEF
jgi:hypothetical protein